MNIQEDLLTFVWKLKGIDEFSGRVVWEWTIRFESVFSKQPQQRSKVNQRLNWFRNTLCPPNLVGRNSDRRVIYCWSQRSYRVSRGQTWVKLLKNALWLSNLVGRTPARSEVQCWGERPCGISWSQPEFKLLKCPIATKCGQCRFREYDVYRCFVQPTILRF